MKRIVYIALGAILLSACTKQEPVCFHSEERMAFQTAMYSVATKAAGSYTTYSTKNTFGTFALSYSPDSVAPGDAQYGWTGNNTFTYNIRNEEVRFMNVLGQSIWSTDTEYYWPSAGYLRFASYSPYARLNDVASYSRNEGGLKFTGYQMPGDAAAQQKIVESTPADSYDMCDLMVADEVSYDCAAVYADDNLPSQTYYFNGVATLFRHITTQLNFEFKQKAVATTYTQNIVVKEVKLSGVHLTADYVAGAWTPAAQTTDDLVLYENAVGQKLNTVNPTNLVERYYAIPQTLAPSTATPAFKGQQLTITYSIISTIAGKYIEETITETVDLYKDVMPTWGLGKSLTYTITLSPVREPILFTAYEATEWKGANVDLIN